MVGSTNFCLDQGTVKALDWLSPLYKDFTSKQLETFNIAARQDRIGRWLMETDQYKTWLASPSSTLGCIGMSMYFPTLGPLCTEQ